MRKLITGVTLSVAVCTNVLAAEISQLDSSIDFRAVYWHGNQVWASGTAGSIYMSADNGKKWQPITAPQNSDQLEFRDLQPLGDGKVLLMSSGEGDDSRIYQTSNYGADWRQVSSSDSSKQFYDCLQMIDKQTGYLYGDSDDKGLFVLQTDDGGNSWQRVELPIPAQDGEGGFASSGTCVNRGNSNIQVVIGTGNVDKPRLLLRDQSGWLSIETPFTGGAASGVFSVQLSGDEIYAFGGSLNALDKPAVGWKYNLLDQHWQVLPPIPLKGAVYGSAIFRNGDSETVWVANPNGVAVLGANGDYSKWEKRSKLNMWSIACRDNVGCISVGQQGTMQRFVPKTNVPAPATPPTPAPAPASQATPAPVEDATAEPASADEPHLIDRTAPATESTPAPADEPKPVATEQPQPPVESTPATADEPKPAPAEQPQPAVESTPAPADEPKPAPAEQAQPAAESTPAPADESKPAPTEQPQPAAESTPAPADEPKPTPH